MPSYPVVLFYILGLRALLFRLQVLLFGPVFLGNSVCALLVGLLVPDGTAGGQAGVQTAVLSVCTDRSLEAVRSSRTDDLSINVCFQG